MNEKLSKAIKFLPKAGAIFGGGFVIGAGVTFVLRMNKTHRECAEVAGMSVKEFKNLLKESTAVKREARIRKAAEEREEAAIREKVRRQQKEYKIRKQMEKESYGKET
jgi:Sec-independent protein translocase protein TatA